MAAALLAGLSACSVEEPVTGGADVPEKVAPAGEGVVAGVLSIDIF